jgi:hypothetical protein
VFKDFGITPALQALYKAQDEAREVVPCTNDPDLFFPEQGGAGGINHIRRICAGCPIVLQCAEYGIDNEHFFGIWGGLTVDERATIRRARSKVQKTA